MIYYSNSFLPILTIKKVYISSNRGEIVIDFALRSNSRTSVLQSMLNNPALEALRIYFIILDDDTESVIGDLSRSKATRATTLRNILDHNAYGLVESSAISSISLRDTILRQITMNQTQGDLDDNASNEIYCSIKLDYDRGAPYRHLDVENIHLVGFINGDMSNLNPGQESHVSMGPVVYEKLMTRDNSQYQLRPPLFRNVFYVSELENPELLAASGFTASQPYAGPVHYHDESNAQNG